MSRPFKRSLLLLLICCARAVVVLSQHPCDHIASEVLKGERLVNDSRPGEIQYIIDIDENEVALCDTVLRARYQRLLSLVYLGLEDMMSADAAVKKGLSLFSHAGIIEQNPADYARLLALQGSLQSMSGEYALSLRTFDEVITVMETHDLEDPQTEKFIYNGQAINYLLLGRQHQSIAMFSKLDTLLTNSGEWAHNVYIHKNLASAYFELGDSDKGWAYLLRSVKAQERHPEVFGEDILAAYTSCIDRLMDMNQLDEARRYASKGMAKVSETEDPRFLAHFFESLGLLAYEKPEKSKALEHFQTAIGYLDHLAEGGRALLIYPEDYLAIKARIIHMKAEEFSDHPDSLMALYEEIDTILNQCAGIWSSEPTVEGRAYLHDIFMALQDAHIKVVSLLAARGALGRAALLKKTIELDHFYHVLWLEQYRSHEESRILSAHGDRRVVQWYNGIDSLTLLLEELDAVIDEEAHMQQNRQIHAWTDSIRAWRRSWGLELTPLRPEVTDKHMETLESTLDSGGTIYYFMHSTYHLNQVLITADTVLYHYIGSEASSDLDTISNDILAWMSEFVKDSTDQKVPTKLMHLGRDLYNVIAPLEAHWTEEVVVFQTNYLASIPFSAINTRIPEHSYDHENADYLIEDYLINYGWSLSTWLDGQMDRPAESISSQDIGFWLPEQFEEGAMIEGAQSIQLVYARHEASAIQQLTGGSEIDAAYSPGELTFLEDVDWLHLSAHTTHTEEGLDEIVLPVVVDTSLMYYSARGIRFKQDQPELIFANACETNVGLEHVGRGGYSFIRDFALSGVPNIINTSWLVEDSKGAELSVSFYEKCLEGISSDVALRRAQLELLEENDPYFSHPFYWAGYMHYGDGANAHRQGNNLVWLGGLVIGLLGWIGYRRYAQPRKK